MNIYNLIRIALLIIMMAMCILFLMGDNAIVAVIADIVLVVSFYKLVDVVESETKK